MTSISDRLFTACVLNRIGVNATKLDLVLAQVCFGKLRLIVCGALQKKASFGLYLISIEEPF